MSLQSNKDSSFLGIKDVSIDTTSEGEGVDWRSQVAEMQKKKQREIFHATPVKPEVVSLVLELARSKGRTCFADIREEVNERLGLRLSGTTVVNILVRHGARRGGEMDRMRMAEQRILAGELVGENLRTRVLRFNPALQERDRESAAPGELLTQAMFPVELVPGQKRWHVHAAVDTYGTLAFATLSQDASTDMAVEFLHTQVLPWYAKHGQRVGCIETCRQRIYYGGDDTHVYQAYLKLNDIRQHVIPKTKPSMNGFMARFKQMFTSSWLLPLRVNGGQVPEGQVQPKDRHGELNAHLAQWLHHYNHETQLHGYRNNGLTPMAFWCNAS